MNISTQNIQLYRDKERQIYYDRAKRKSMALRQHIDSQYLTSPKMTLEGLQGLKTLLEKQFLENPNNDKVLTLLTQTITKITNEDYLKPDTEDMIYANAYKTHLNQFVWPTNEELELQNQENAELENLKNSF